MKPAEMLIARHGETDWNKIGKWQGISDIPLNETGESQARALGISLKGEHIERIFSSDLLRARRTAQIVSEIIGVRPVIADGRLRERNLGKFEGWNFNDVAAYAGIPKEKAYLLEIDEVMIDGLPGVELWSIFQTRILGTIQEISRASNSDKILIIAHGGVMRAITMALSPEGKAKLDFENGECLRLKPNGNSWIIF